MLVGEVKRPPTYIVDRIHLHAAPEDQPGVRGGGEGQRVMRVRVNCSIAP